MNRKLFLILFICYSPLLLPQFCGDYQWQCFFCTHRYEIDSSIPFEYSQYIDDAASAWNGGIGGCTHLEENLAWFDESGMIQWGNLNQVSCNNGTLGETIKTLSNGKIIYCVTIINSHSSLHWSTSSTPGPEEFDFITVMIHEFGHWLGLYDQFNLTSTMGYTPCGFARRYITSDAAYCAQLLCFELGVEDELYVYTDHELYNVNTTHVGCQHSTFIDNGPPPSNYITEWYAYNVWASSSCGDILVSTNGIIIPTLPIGYDWNRDENGYVIANMTRSVIDNNGVLHTGSAQIKIGNVPNTFISSGTLTSDTYWCGTINITGNITVPQNITLNISPGTVVNFNNNSSLVISGTLDAMGFQTNKITLDFISPNTSVQNGIKVNAGGNLNVSNLIIKNAYRGIYVNEASASINGTEIFNCFTGIYLYRTSYTLDDPYITNNYLHNNAYYSSGGGIANYYSSPYITGNEIGNNYIGITASNSSSPLLGYAGVYGNNNIHHNYMGVYAISYSNPFLGRETCTLQGGNNIIENNTSYNMLAQSNCIVLAENNWWGSNPPVANKIVANSGSTIDYFPYLESLPEQQFANLKNSPEESLYDQNFSVLQSDTGFTATENSIVNNFNPAWPIFWKLLYARNLIDVKKYNYAQEILKQVITSNSDSSLSHYALDLLWRASRKFDKDSLNTFLDILSKRSGRKNIYAHAQLILAGYDKVNRIQKLDAVIGSYPNTPFAEMAIFQKFLYYFNEQNDLIKAREISNQMDVLFPNSELTKDANSHLEGTGSVPKMAANPDDSEDSENLASNLSIPTEYQLLGNYPNPFNPSTTISYALPFESEVVVNIFDLTGSIIKSFNLNNQTAGYKTLNWDGKNNSGTAVSSGIYIYSIKAVSTEGNGKSFVKSSKLMLLK